MEDVRVGEQHALRCGGGAGGAHHDGIGGKGARAAWLGPGAQDFGIPEARRRPVAYQYSGAGGAQALRPGPKPLIDQERAQRRALDERIDLGLTEFRGERNSDSPDHATGEIDRAELDARLEQDTDTITLAHAVGPLKIRSHGARQAVKFGERVAARIVIHEGVRFGNAGRGRRKSVEERLGQAVERIDARSPDNAHGHASLLHRIPTVTAENHE